MKNIKKFWCLIKNIFSNLHAKFPNFWIVDFMLFVVFSYAVFGDTLVQPDAEHPFVLAVLFSTFAMSFICGVCVLLYFIVREIYTHIPRDSKWIHKTTHDIRTAVLDAIRLCEVGNCVEGTYIRCDGWRPDSSGIIRARILYSDHDPRFPNFNVIYYDEVEKRLSTSWIDYRDFTIHDNQEDELYVRTTNESNNQ